MTTSPTAARTRAAEAEADARRRAGNRGSLTPQQVATYDAEGYLVLPDLLHVDDLAAAQSALTEKVDTIASELVAAGLISDPLAGEPFRTRLALLFDGLDPEYFLTFGRSWRDRIGGITR